MKKYTLRDGSTMIMDGMTGTVNEKQGKVTQLDSVIVTAFNDRLMDADGAFFFQRQLEYIKARSYDVQYADLLARSLFPVSNEGGKGINSITYRTYDQVGLAKIISAYADDLPRADVHGSETTIPVRSVGTAYGYNLDEIQSSQLTGASLDQRRADAAVRSVEEVVNSIAFFGDDKSGLVGLFNHPNIPKGTVTPGANSSTWDNKEPDEILFDVNEIFAGIFESTNMKERPNTLLIPPSQWSYIMSTPRSATSDTTIGMYLVQNSPYINSLADIVSVNECAAIHNDVLTNDAMVAYDKNPNKLQMEVPVELEMLPIQMKNLEFVIPGRARIAGLNIYYPLSLSIVEGI